MSECHGCRECESMAVELQQTVVCGECGSPSYPKPKTYSYELTWVEEGQFGECYVEFPDIPEDPHPYTMDEAESVADYVLFVGGPLVHYNEQWEVEDGKTSAK